MRRLFSTFARGWPGAGLLVLRLAASGVLLNQAAMRVPDHSLQSLVIALFAGAVAILLLVGLWTPIAGAIALFIELTIVFTRTDKPRICMLLGVVGIAIAMIGPGAWSIDARRYGWKRIDHQDR